MTSNVEGTGDRGDTVSVKRGFARNFLIPNKMAAYNTEANREKYSDIIRAKEFTSEATAKAKKSAREQYEALQQAMEHLARSNGGSIDLILSSKSTEDGNLYGSVSAADIAAKLRSDEICGTDTGSALGSLTAADVKLDAGEVIKTVGSGYSASIAGQKVNITVNAE